MSLSKNFDTTGSILTARSIVTNLQLAVLFMEGYNLCLFKFVWKCDTLVLTSNDFLFGVTSRPHPTTGQVLQSSPTPDPISEEDVQMFYPPNQR
jgi:hypothetical protein